MLNVEFWFADLEKFIDCKTKMFLTTSQTCSAKGLSSGVNLHIVW